MKRGFRFFPLVCLLLLSATSARGGEWEGTIQGLNCVLTGEVCPVNMEDPMAALESSFVLYLEDGSWYLLPNLNRGVLARHLNQTVYVTGRKNPNYNVIQVESMKVWEKEAWRNVWSPELEEELRGILEFYRRQP